MIRKANIYKGMGYFFPAAVLSALATGLPGAIALIFYWSASLQAKKAYVKELSQELKLLEKMQDEVKMLIGLCSRCITK